MNFDWQLFLCALGLALVLESLPWLLAPEQFREALRSLIERQGNDLRRWGMFLLGIGLFLIVLGRV